MTQTLTGYDAIEFAYYHTELLCKHADPLEGARSDLGVEEAVEIAREDDSLIWISAKTVGVSSKVWQEMVSDFYEYVVVCSDYDLSQFDLDFLI